MYINKENDEMMHALSLKLILKCMKYKIKNT